MEGGAARWRIKEFSTRVGVPEATLRAWELRYRVLHPARTASGYRLYGPGDERRIRSMQGHMSAGMAAAEAASMALLEAPPAEFAAGQAEALVAALLDATTAYDATRFDALLDVAVARGPALAIREVILPCLVAIGEQWEREELTIGHEHFATHLIERRLLLMAALWDRGPGPLALLACPSGERHTLGLICFGVALAASGWRIAYLGADTPIAEVAEACATLRPAAVVLCALDPRHFERSAAAISALGAAQEIHLAGAGADPALSERLGVHSAAGDPVAAAEALTVPGPLGSA